MTTPEGGTPGGDPEFARAMRSLAGAPVRDLGLYRLAFTHASHAHDAGLPSGPNSYERLEFLGDAVIGLAISEHLMARAPDAEEGDLTRWRSASVRADALARVAEGLGLARWAVLGQGEDAQGGRRRLKLLSDLLEALVGAIHLDLGWEASRAFVLRHLGQVVEEALAAPPVNARGQLQERLQREGSARIEYEVVEASGPPHRPRFTVEVRVDGETLGRAEGGSKKDAAARAAQQALDRLKA